MRFLKLFSLLAFLFMAACITKATNPNVEVVSPTQFSDRLNSDANAYLLDVRKHDEFSAGHLKGAHLLNWLDTDDFKLQAKELDKTKTIYVYCRSGRRSNEAANYLAEQGFKVVDMDGGILAWEEQKLPIVKSENTSELFEKQGVTHDTFTTKTGHEVKIHFIKNSSLVLEVNGKMIYVDPTGMFGHDFARLPKADAIMVTHEHRDHFAPKAIEAVSKDDTRFIVSKRVAELVGKGHAVVPGDTLDLFGINVTATPAYNISEGHLQFHPRERQDVGFVYDIDGLRIYVAGDTEDIPEMATLKDIDVAFLPVNQPFTMTPEQAIHAIKMINPRIVYPYHHGDTELTPITTAFKDSDIVVRLRSLQ